MWDYRYESLRVSLRQMERQIYYHFLLNSNGFEIKVHLSKIKSLATIVKVYKCSSKLWTVDASFLMWSWIINLWTLAVWGVSYQETWCKAEPRDGSLHKRRLHYSTWAAKWHMKKVHPTQWDSEHNSLWMRNRCVLWKWIKSSFLVTHIIKSPA